MATMSAPIFFHPACSTPDTRDVVFANEKERGIAANRCRTNAEFEGGLFIAEISAVVGRNVVNEQEGTRTSDLRNVSFVR